jgi:hypothetical protein
MISHLLVVSIYSALVAVLCYRLARFWKPFGGFIFGLVMFMVSTLTVFHKEVIFFIASFSLWWALISLIYLMRIVLDKIEQNLTNLHRVQERTLGHLEKHMATLEVADTGASVQCVQETLQRFLSASDTHLSEMGAWRRYFWLSVGLSVVGIGLWAWLFWTARFDK